MCEYQTRHGYGLVHPPTRPHMRTCMHTYMRRTKLCNDKKVCPEWKKKVGIYWKPIIRGFGSSQHDFEVNYHTSLCRFIAQLLSFQAYGTPPPLAYTRTHTHSSAHCALLPGVSRQQRLPMWPTETGRPRTRPDHGRPEPATCARRLDRASSFHSNSPGRAYTHTSLRVGGWASNRRDR